MRRGACRWCVGRSGRLGSGGGIRTRDPTIMSRVLLPTELLRRAERARGPAPGSPLTDSNRRPLPYHGSALPTELRGRGPARIAARPVRRARSRSMMGAVLRTRLVEPARRRGDPRDLQRRGARVDGHVRPRAALARRSRWPGSTSTRAAIPRSSPSTATTVVGFASLSPVPAAPGLHADGRGLRVRAPRPPRAGRRRAPARRPRRARAATTGSTRSIGRIVGGHDASIALHATCGFEQVGVEREVGRKFGKWLDVVLMQKML